MQRHKREASWGYRTKTNTARFNKSDVHLSTTRSRRIRIRMTWRRATLNRPTKSATNHVKHEAKFETTRRAVVIRGKRKHYGRRRHQHQRLPRLKAGTILSMWSSHTQSSQTQPTQTTKFTIERDMSRTNRRTRWKVQRGLQLTMKQRRMQLRTKQTVPRIAMKHVQVNMDRSGALNPD